MIDAGAGVKIESIYKMYLINKGSMYLCDYESFEEFLLKILGDTYIPDFTCINKEKGYADRLHELLSQYSKSKTISACFIQCKQCHSCNYANELLNSRKAFERSYLSKYVEVP